jgi:hypothetical protein
MSDSRQGCRWLDLIDTVKSEEILLVPDDSIHVYSSGTPLQRCAISQIVSDGTDDDFQRLKQLLKTTFSCVQTTCAKLDGFIALFTRAQTLMAHGDLIGAQDIGHQLQDLTTACFGDRAHVRTRMHYFFEKYEEALKLPMAVALEEGASDEEILHLESELENWYRQTNGDPESSTQEQNRSSQSEPEKIY